MHPEFERRPRLAAHTASARRVVPLARQESVKIAMATMSVMKRPGGGGTGRVRARAAGRRGDDRAPREPRGDGGRPGVGRPDGHSAGLRPQYACG